MLPFFSSINDYIKTKKIVNDLYTAIADSISEDVYHDYPVVRAIKDLIDTIHDITTISYRSNLSSTLDSDFGRI